MEIITFGVAAAVEEYAATRPDSATAVLYDSGMTSIATPTVTIDNVDTTLAGGCAAGDLQVRLTSVSNIVPGRCYELGTAASETVERVKVRRVTSDIVELQHPTLYQHAQGAVFESARMSVAITAATFTAPAWDCLLRISPVIGGVTQEYRDIALAVSRYALTSDVTPSLIQSRLDPQLLSRVGYGTDWTEVVDGARRALNRDITTSWDAWNLRGRNDAYHSAHLWACLRLVAMQYAAPSERDFYAREYQHVLDQVKASSNVDNDQDGTIEANEGGLVSIPIFRA